MARSLKDGILSREKAIIAIVLSILVLTAYWGVAQNDFINYDDPGYVTDNINVRAGLRVNAFIWAFTTDFMCNWHPLTWVSLMVDRELFGVVNAGGYHWTNVILHLLAGLMLYFALGRMTGRLFRSGLTAGLFLLHPLHVESVAWIAERKDVLSGMFWMLGLWGYARYVERPGFIRYGWVLLFFVFGLLSKPMVVTFPFVLLLLDYWPLCRMKARKEGIARLVYEKVPLFFFSLVSSIMTFLVQQKGGAVAPLESLPLVKRLVNAVISYLEYLRKTLLPIDLAIFYPYHAFVPPWRLFESILILIFITLMALFFVRRRPYLLVGWLWYLGTLIPVIGLVQVGSQAMADRYTYLPLVGVFIILIWGVSDSLNRLPLPKCLWAAVSVIILLTLAAATKTQVGYWKDSVTLFTQAIRNTERNYSAHYTLALALSKSGNPQGAMDHYREALRIRPTFAEAHNGLGHLLMLLGRYDEANDHFKTANRNKPNYAAAMKNLGDLRMRQGKTDEAIVQYRRAYLIEPDDPELFNNYGVALFNKRQRNAAIVQIKEALRLKPDYIEARNNLQKILGHQAGP